MIPLIITYGILILKTFLISWIINHFMPLHAILEGVNQGLFMGRYKKTYMIFAFLIKKLECAKCTNLWIGLIISGGNPFVAIISAIIGYHYDKIDSKIEIRF